MPHRINIAIATYDRVPLLRRTLESLAQVDRPANFDRAIVVENGSDTGARQVCEEVGRDFPIEYRHQEQPGKSRALQGVLEDLKDGFIVYLDDDVRVSPQLLNAYAEAIEKDGDQYYYGGPMEIDYETGPPPKWLFEFVPNCVTGWHPVHPQRIERIEWFYGCNFGAFTQRVLEVGGFNANFGPGAMVAGTEQNPMGQETEMQARLFKAGYKTRYVPDALVWHWVPKERCSPAWALHRAYRHGITDGLKDKNAHVGPRWRGAPRWMWRVWAGLRLSSLVANLMPNAQARFLVKREYQRWRGMMQSIRMADDAKETAQAGE